VDVSIPVWYDWKAAMAFGKDYIVLFQFQYGTIGSRSTTQKNKLILNGLTLVKLAFFPEKIVDPLKRIFPKGSTILYM